MLKPDYFLRWPSVLDCCQQSSVTFWVSFQYLQLSTLVMKVHSASLSNLVLDRNKRTTTCHIVSN
jgi:hypothetical protein